MSDPARAALHRDLRVVGRELARACYADTRAIAASKLPASTEREGTEKKNAASPSARRSRASDRPKLESRREGFATTASIVAA